MFLQLGDVYLFVSCVKPKHADYYFNVKHNLFKNLTKSYFANNAIYTTSPDWLWKFPDFLNTLSFSKTTNVLVFRSYDSRCPWNLMKSEYFEEYSVIAERRAAVLKGKKKKPAHASLMLPCVHDQTLHYVTSMHTSICCFLWILWERNCRETANIQHGPTQAFWLVTVDMMIRSLQATSVTLSLLLDSHGILFLMQHVYNTSLY